MRPFRGRWPVSRADQVRAYVAAVDADCPQCGYCLRGLRDPRCPECGLDLDVQSIRRGKRWFPEIGELVPSGVRPVVAANIVLALAVIASAVAHHGQLPRLAWLAPAVLGAFACSVAYWPVFVRSGADSIEAPTPVLSAAWIAAAMQAAGLALLWL